MQTQSMLNGLACILETFAMDDNCIDNSDVVVTRIESAVDDSMVFTMTANDGTVKTFLITEVDD